MIQSSKEKLEQFSQAAMLAKEWTSSDARKWMEDYAEREQD